VRTFAYETTWKASDGAGNVVLSAELRFLYTYRPGQPEYYDASIGGMGGWQPADPDEIEIVMVMEEYTTSPHNEGGARTRWIAVEGKRPNGEDVAQHYIAWAMSERRDEMIEHASQPEDERQERAEP